MAKPRDPVRDYNRGLDLVFQEIQDRKDQVLFECLKAVGSNRSDAEVRAFIAAVRALGIAKGMTPSESRASGDDLLNFAIDNNMFDANLDVKPED